MIQDLKPYPAMKDSAVPWLGVVPEHWEVKRAKTLFGAVDIRSASGDEELLTVSSNLGVVPRRSANVTMFKAESYAGHKLCWPGDLVINSLWAWSRGLGVSRHHGIVSTAYGVYRTRDAGVLDPRFVHELVRSTPFHWELRVRSKGVWTSRLQLTDESFLGAPFPLPPLPEQAAIVRFLDYADRRIRRYIRAKQKLIELLEEQKQAIIHRAVTRGLDPDARLKPSGVEWLGDVPEHWQVVALRHRYSQCLGKMLDSKRITGSHSLPYLRNIDVQWDRINVVELPSMDISPAEYDRYTVKAGDLLVCEGGDVGRCALWSGQLEVCGFQKALHRLRPQRAAEEVPRFLYYALRAAAKRSAFDDGHQSTIAHLTGDKLRAHRFAFPPRAEQAALAVHLDRSLEALNRAVGSAEAESALLREYRTRLIADVVTGKLDVREAASRLADQPDETDEAGADEIDQATEVPDLEALDDDLEAV